MRGNRIQIAMAAALVMAVVGVWQSTSPRSLFGATLQAMIDAKGYSCDMFDIAPGDGGDENATLGSRVFWALNGDERIEGIALGKVREIEIHRPGRSGLKLLPDAKEFKVLDESISREFSFGLFGQLSQYKGRAESRLGAKEIRGCKVNGFVIPWSSLTGREAPGNAKLSIWLDSSTSLPVRVDCTGFVPNQAGVVRLENFQWGVQDAKLFDTSIPPGYAPAPKSDVTDEQITEYVVYGLSVFAKYNNGKYPAVKYVYGDEQGEALRSLMGMDPKAQGWVKLDKKIVWKTPKEGEFAHGTSGLSWINGLQREHPECVYHGRTVTSKDAEKVLLRWRRDDGRYRVIFGDLRASDESAERLKELEAK